LEKRLVKYWGKLMLFVDRLGAKPRRGIVELA
jgi:hypothetical protein